MEHNKLIIFKAAIALGALGCFVILKRSVKANGDTTRAYLPGCLAMWFFSRLGLFFVMFVLLGLEVPSDVPTYYYGPGKHVLAGKLVYRDFTTSYGPLFPYVAAGAVTLWDSPKIFVLLAISFEGVAILLWHRVARRALTAYAASLGTLLCLCNPLAILNVAVGQNQVWVSAFLAAGSLMMLARREWRGGIFLGLSVAVVKVLGLMFAPLWWLAGASRWKLIAGFMGTCAVTLLPFWLAGADILSPVKHEGELSSSGNLPFLLTLVGLDAKQRIVGAVLTLLLLAAIAGLSVFFARTARPRTENEFPLLGMSAILLVFMLLSKKSYTNYMNLLMPALCCSAVVVLRRRWFLEVFLLWSGLAALEPSLWHRWFLQAPFNEIWRRSGEFSAFKPVAFTLIELLLIGGYVILLWLLVRQHRATANASVRSLPS